MPVDQTSDRIVYRWQHILSGYVGNNQLWHVERHGGITDRHVTENRARVWISVTVGSDPLVRDSHVTKLDYALAR
jgi:hypothetical protein